MDPRAKASSASVQTFQPLRTPPLDDEDEEETHMEEEEEEEEDREQEEEDDDDEDEPVTLGFLEKAKSPSRLHRHMFPSKAGGPPAWLDPVELPPERSRVCGFCGEPLQFLLQVYAPLSENRNAFHRTLFVFMCTSMRCLLRDQHEQWKRTASNPSRSVKVFRCQMPRDNPFYSRDPPKEDGSDRPPKDGVPLCCWCGTWKGEKVCSSCKKACYCSEKHQTMHWRAGHRSECRQIVASEICDSTVKGKYPNTSKVLYSTLWPEFEIVSEDECVFTEEGSEDNDSATALVSKRDDTDEMFQTFTDNFETDSDKKSWASFQERIAKAPDQILRYCRDAKAKPLWPVSSGRPTDNDIPRCAHCSSHLCYEFQILPQLLYYFGVKNDVDSLDWATIVIYACAASCDAGLRYKEEFAWVQLYSTTPVA